MLTAAIVSIVGACTRHPWRVIAIAAVLSLASAVYVATHFRINTDAESLLPRSLPWQQNQLAYQATFPQYQILVVLQGPTPETVQSAADRLTARLSRNHDRFSTVRQPQGGEFMTRNALLFLPPDQVESTARRLAEAQPVLGILTEDPSLRGAMKALSLGIGAAQAGRVPAQALLGPMQQLSGTLADVLDSRFATFSWQALLSQNGATGGNVGKPQAFILVEPKLDFTSLQPGHAATTAIEQAAADLRLQTDYGVQLSLTGRVPLDDAEFSTLSESAIPELLGTVVAVLVILWLALRSVRIIAAGFGTLAVGFVVTAAVGLLMVGAFNLISVAFAILFVGLGADFAIQFSVRYRAERHEHDALRPALALAAQKAGRPLALAALSTAVGFLCFLPTSYSGVAELGEIAGVGMLIAFGATLTVMPALLALLHPPGEPETMGFKALAPADRFFARHRIAVVVGTLAVVAAASPLLAFMKFDFNPIHLQDQNSEAVRTYRELVNNPNLGISAANVLVPNVDAIPPMRQRLERLPQVRGTRSIESLVPSDQGPKIAAIRQAAAALRPMLDRPEPTAGASDADDVEALKATAAGLQQLAAAAPGPVAEAAKQLQGLLTRLAGADPEVRKRATEALIRPLRFDLRRLRLMLDPQPVTIASLPPDFARDWVAPDGRARIEVLPKGNPGDTSTTRAFAKAVLAVAPKAAGEPIALVMSQGTVVRAFIEAGIYAILAIGLILWIALRRFGDVLLTLVPLLVAAAVTLEVTVAIGESLNFANVIALPLLLGVGVAFKIYYVMAWRAGRTNLLQSTLTRAVFFSALTTATSFGSLWLSREPGMSSMGELMVIALLCTMAAAVLFQPALMGPPRALGAGPALPDEPNPDKRQAARQPADVELTLSHARSLASLHGRTRIKRDVRSRRPKE
ncbi:MAG TPA: MMPL family transporter [Stellaceae bacterium]|nr:MMPL family transporter [Stellaceae bacterium]